MKVTRELRGIQKELEKAGFVYVCANKHIKFRHPSGATFVLSESKAHMRSVKNMVAEARRTIRRVNQ